MSYGIYKTNNISSFFASYVRNSTGFYESTLAKTYANPLFYFICFLIAILSLILLILMKQKEKPTKLYFIITLLYIGVIILISMDSGYLRTINFEQLSPRNSRLLRDINLIALFPQIVLIFLVLIRAIGFNIKKFNFAKDIEDLNIDVSDNEEFELTFGTNPDKLNRILRKNQRELKYFYLEHKPMILGILLSLFLFLGWTVYYRVIVLNKIFNQNEVVRINNISYKIEGFYSSNLNYRSENITEGNNIFLILKLRIYNGNEYNIKLNTENMRIIIGENIYLPIIRKYDEFKDIGNGYEDNIIDGDSEASYIFVYSVPNQELSKNMLLRYAERISFDVNGVTNRYLKYYIKPESLDEVSIFPIAELGKEVNYTISNLKNTKLKINSFETNIKFSYGIDNIINVINDPMDNRIIMKIVYDYTPDESVQYVSSFEKLMKEHGSIRYYKQGKEYVINYKDVTPSKNILSIAYYSVLDDIVNAEKIELVIKIRNLIYIHKLK
ncbi:MAG: hypothetical protein GX032_02675 [Tenericutes bacterium]|nr:hypothetical protein [Mycoplasmatota bacterium]